MCLWQEQSNGYEAGLMVDLAEVATREEQGWEELILVQVGQEVTKERVSSVQAQWGI